MHYVSLIVEFLRGRPAWVFWIATLSQAFLWFAIPSLFYSAPPGELPAILAIGHEFRLGSDLGPPLAFWCAEWAFRLGGAVGVYLAAQISIVVAFWAVFSLGRAIVGTRHAVLAILFMTGIAAFNVPSPEFGPSILALPFWALSLLFYWRAVGLGQRGAWFVFGVCMGLLLLSSYLGVILLLLLLIYTAANPRGWSEFRHPEPWLALLLIIFVVLPHVGFIEWSPALALNAIGLDATPMLHVSASAALRLIAAVLLTHLGVAVLMLLASGWPRRRRELAPVIERLPVPLYGRIYIYVFALAPALIAAIMALAIGRSGPLDRVAPLVLLTGLAVITAAGDQVLLYRERIVSFAWLGLLVLPPLGAALAIAVLPWTLGTNLSMAQPANTMGQYFGDAFQRRTGQPLPYVAGDQQLAELIAVGAPSRPHVFLTATPARSPWAKPDDIRARGGVLVWPSTDPAGTPPAAIKAAFPDLVAEVPRIFARTMQGRLPVIRVGWAVIRPANAPPAPATR